jgi:hypothetical protein
MIWLEFYNARGPIRPGTANQQSGAESLTNDSVPQHDAIAAELASLSITSENESNATLPYEPPALAAVPLKAEATQSAIGLDARTTTKSETASFNEISQATETDSHEQSTSHQETTSMSILSEAIQQTLLQSPDEEPEEDFFAVPHPISSRQIEDIPMLPNVGDAAQLVTDMTAEIDLIEARSQAAAKAERLENLRKARNAPRCRHVLSSEDPCGSPALKGQEYCRFHGQAHAPEIELPVIEDADSLQLAYMSVAQRLAAKTLDAARGKVLLQTIQCAARNLEAYQSDE